jgi:TM2 domain-containing membrane protein YozV
MGKQLPTRDIANEAALEVDLKDPRVAAFLAWLLPGAGHFYQGRNGKGLLFFVCIVGTFVYGLYIGQGRVVYAADTSPLSRQFFQRWQYICQVGIGLPALPALVQTARMNAGKAPLLGYEIAISDDYHFSPMRPPRMAAPPNDPFTTQDDAKKTVTHPHELAKWYYDLGDMFEIGTVFTIIAGLLNVLAIYDAYGGPLLILPPGDKKKSTKDDTGTQEE